MLSTLEIQRPRRLAVLGVGLLGASVLRAARVCLPNTKLSAWSRSPSSRKAVADIADTFNSPSEAVRGADCIILGAPVDALPSLLESIHPSLSAEAWVTDVGSTKRGIHAAASVFLTKPERFIGSHPMAGSEKGGAEQGHAKLFVGRPCIITTSDKTDLTLVKSATALWSALGATVIQMTPEAHDEAVAAISHLPHATACALAHLLSKKTARLDLAAGGLRDTTRIAAGDPSLWLPILLENADHLIPLLKELEESSAELRNLLAKKDAGGIRTYLDGARAFRRRLD
jgi:prephenate dehydrogenase